nr:luminal-binding protein 4 [Ipomoea trifida]
MEILTLDVRAFVVMSLKVKGGQQLGNFDLTAIAIVRCALPSGTPEFEVTFEVDANGILNEEASKLGTVIGVYKDQCVEIIANDEAKVIALYHTIMGGFTDNERLIGEACSQEPSRFQP